MKVRRLRKEAAALEVTAFINLIVVLVPFLLSTAVFTRLAVLDLSLPAQSSGVEQLKVDDLKLEITIRPDAIEVADRIGGLIERLPHQAGAFDTARLSGVMQQLKLRFPEAKAATVLAQPETSYERLVQVMDTVREATRSEGNQLVRSALFPDIAIGDAPIVARR
jgi:biopolymer transport protein ExbD